MVQAQRAGLELLLLRGFELRSRGEPLELPVGSQRLLAFLALHDRPLHRAHVAGSLWPNTLDAKAAANLRSALWRLRRPGPDVLAATPVHLSLDPAVWVDVRTLEDVAYRLLHEPDQMDLAAIDPHALGGELLPDLWDAWVVIERERLRQVSLHALEALCKRCLDAGYVAHAVLAGTMAVEADPLRESANRVLIEAHLAEGNRSEAIRQFECYERLLCRELDLEPSHDLRALVGRHAPRPSAR